MKKLLWTIFKTLIKLAIAVLIARDVYILIAPYAYAYRGYLAFGGEVLLAVILCIGAYFVMGKADELPEKGEVENHGR